MNHVPIIPQTAPTWRDSVAQDVVPRPRTFAGKRRLAFASLRHWLAVGVVAACLVFGYIGWLAWRDNPTALAAPAPEARLRDIAVRTDGVLDRAWVERTLGVKSGVALMDLDLAALQARLLASGQVSNAVVARRFPDVLVVILEERSPVLRVRAQGSDGEYHRLFVARDGAVFSGERYDDRLTEGLPWLSGVSLSRNPVGPGFARLEGLDVVSELLGTARSSAPALARSFEVVSLARYARDGVILVRTPEVSEIAFGTRDDFYRQLARLDYILDELRARPDAAPIRLIDLATGGRQVPVSFSPPVSPAAETRPSASAAPVARPSVRQSPTRPVAAPETRAPLVIHL